MQKPLAAFSSNCMEMTEEASVHILMPFQIIGTPRAVFSHLVGSIHNEQL